MAAVGVAPTLMGFAGLVYGVIAAVLGAIFFALAIEVFRKRRGAAADTAAKRLFAFSILYLFLLFAILLVEGIGW
jgi:protoheme IX farnesyltransferase